METEMDPGGGDRWYGPPRLLDVEQFASARAAEVKALHTVLKERGYPATQRHLRRRTTSYNRRKFHWSRKCRQKEGQGKAGQAEEEVEEEEKIRAPCRRVRRRIELKGVVNGGGGKARDGTQRLVTHVWHAKRFKMKKVWGYWLAEGLTGRGRGSRAVIRWTNESAVLHDASYWSPIELQGSADDILNVLALVLDPPPQGRDGEVGREQLEFRGAQYGNAVLHLPGSAPYKVIAPISYMWRPISFPGVLEDRVEEGAKRQIWIWVHAAAVKDALHSLQTACSLQDGQVRCESKIGEFGRLDLLGSGAYKVLQKVLHPFSRGASAPGTIDHLQGDASLEGQLHGGHPQPVATLSSKLLGITEMLFGRAIVAMDVHDPRDAPDKQPSCLPEMPECHEVDISRSPDEDNTKKQEQEPSIGPEELGGDDAQIKVGAFAREMFLACSAAGGMNDVIAHWGDLLINSAIWEMSGWEHPLPEKVLSAKRHQRRLSLFNPEKASNVAITVPGGQEDCERGRSSVCPLLLLKQEHHKPSACGWSLIMPISWVRAFWVPLVFAGGHVIGQRELRWLKTDAGLSSFPFDFPDSGAYADYSSEKVAFLAAYNRKRPPSKQLATLPPHNFKFDGIREEQCDVMTVAPGVDRCNGMVESGCDGMAERGCSEGRATAMEVEDTMPRQRCARSFVARTGSMITQALSAFDMQDLPFFLKECAVPKVSPGSWIALAEETSCFVRLLIRAPRKGSFEEGALVCMPSGADVDSWFSRSIRWQGHSQDTQKPRKAFLSEMKMKKRNPQPGNAAEPRDRKKRKLELDDMTSHEDTTLSPAVVSQGKQFKSATELDVENLRVESRDVVGFITSSAVRGSFHNAGVAFCQLLRLGQWRAALQADKRFDDVREIFLLVRNPRSTVYRPAMGVIVLEQTALDVL